MEIPAFETIHYIIAVLAIIVLYLLYKDITKAKTIDIPIGGGQAVRVAI